MLNPMILGTYFNELKKVNKNNSHLPVIYCVDDEGNSYQGLLYYPNVKYSRVQPDQGTRYDANDISDERTDEYKYPVVLLN